MSEGRTHCCLTQFMLDSGSRKAGNSESCFFFWGEISKNLLLIMLLRGRCRCRWDGQRAISRGQKCSLEVTLSWIEN